MMDECTDSFIIEKRLPHEGQNPPEPQQRTSFSRLHLRA